MPLPLAQAAAWSWRILLVAGAATLLGYLVLKIAVVAVPVLLALFVAAVLEPLAARLRAAGWRPALAAGAVFAGALAVVVAGVAWISTSVAGELEDVGTRAREGLDEVRVFLHEEFNVSDEQLTRVQDQLTNTARTEGGTGVAGRVIGGARLAVEAVAGLILTLFTLFFVLKDGHLMATWIRERTPARFRDDVTMVAVESQVVMRQYLKATALTGLIDAVLIGIGLVVLGVPLVVPLALLTFFGGFFPIVGAFLAGLVAALVTLVTNGPGDALIVVGITLAVQQIEGNLLQPFILGPAVRVHELVTVLAVAAGIAIGGILGAFLAVPIVAIAARIGHFYRVRSPSPVPAPP